MFEIFIEPILLGLSSGLFCFSYCLPFIAPYLLSEERQRQENLAVVLKFILGRLVGYIFFGAFFGYLGEKINDNLVDFLINLSLLGLALILFFYTLGLAKKQGMLCLGERFKSRTPLLMGFLMGINVCPPFLISIAYVFTLNSWFLGVIFFLMFFLGTTVYFLPLFFLGFLNKAKEFRAAAKFSALIVSLFFAAYAVYQLLLRLK